MSTIKDRGNSKKLKGTFRKLIRKEVISQLNSSLTDLKAVLGEKKFKNRIKKAAKGLSAGIELKAEKKLVDKPDKKVKAIKSKEIKIAQAE